MFKTILKYNQSNELKIFTCEAKYPAPADAPTNKMRCVQSFKPISLRSENLNKEFKTFKVIGDLIILM